MVKTIGKVIDVFIPQQSENENTLDVIDGMDIGFVIYTTKGIKKIVVEANEENAWISKGDLVLIIEQVISGKYFVDIELYDGDDYE